LHKNYFAFYIQTSLIESGIILRVQGNELKLMTGYVKILMFYKK
jgi:hypothetical protein